MSRLMNTNEWTMALPINSTKNLSVTELENQPEVVGQILSEQQAALQRTDEHYVNANVYKRIDSLVNYIEKHPDWWRNFMLTSDHE